MNEFVKVFPCGREVCSELSRGRGEYRSRVWLMWERQGARCGLCLMPMREADATFDHEAGRGMGGSKRDDRIVHDDGSWRNAALCFQCNGAKGSRQYEWFDGEYVPKK